LCALSFNGPEVSRAGPFQSAEGERKERMKWQGVVADMNTKLADGDAETAELRTKLKG